MYTVSPINSSLEMHTRTRTSFVAKLIIIYFSKHLKVFDLHVLQDKPQSINLS